MSKYRWDPSRPFDPFKHPAAKEMGKDICVSAGAGCGKTSLLVARVINLVEEEGLSFDRILAITFTEKAANEMKWRIIEEFEKQGRWGLRQEVENAPISTIHSFCASLLQENAFAAEVDPGSTVLDEHQAALLLRASLEEILEEVFASDIRQEMFRLTMALTDERHLREALLSTHEKVRSLGLPFSELTILSRPTALEGSHGSDSLSAPSEEALDNYHQSLAQSFIWILEQLDKRYQSKKESLSALDFEDLQLRAKELMRKSVVRDEYRRRFLQVLVDEFQDVNPLQDDIIRQVAGRGDLFIVGDIKQSIYRFRHADVEIFRRRTKEAEEKEDAWRMTLQLNYRSRREIIEFVNRVFSEAWGNEPMPYEELYFGAPLPDGPKQPRIKVLLFPPKEETPKLAEARPMEAVFLARMIKESVEKGEAQVYDQKQQSLRPLRYGDIFILFRSTSDINLYERALESEGVPYYSASSRGFFQRNEIQDVIAILKTIDNPFDDIALASTLRSPWLGIADATLALVAQRAKGEPLLVGLRSVMEELGLPSEESKRLANFLEYLAEMTKIRNRLAPGDLTRRLVRDRFFEAKVLAQTGGRQRLANLRKFCRLVDELGPTALSLSDLLHHIEELAVVPVREGEAPLAMEGSDVVTLMTWHAAKGLEKEMVILPDLCRQPRRDLPRVMVSSDGSLGLNFVVPSRFGKSENADKQWPLIEQQREEEKQARNEDSKRMLYVAMTRAKEFLILSGLKPEKMDSSGVGLKNAIERAPQGTVEVQQITADAESLSSSSWMNIDLDEN